MTVRAKGGRGGRNTEFLLGLAVQLNGAPGIWALAADTDGIDSSEPNAGGVVTPDSLERARILVMRARPFSRAGPSGAGRWLQVKSQIVSE